MRASILVAFSGVSYTLFCSEMNMEPSAVGPDEASTCASPDGSGQETDYRRIVDGIPGCVLVADARGQIVYANRVAVATLGRPLEDLLGNGWLMSLDPSFLGEAWSHWCHCIQTNESLNVTWKFRQYDGAYRWHHLKAEPTTDTDCKTSTWYLLGVDVDEQVKAELALQQSERQMQRMMDTVPSKLWSVAPDGKATFINKKARDYVGMTLDQSQDWGWIQVLYPEEREYVVQEFKKALATGSSYGTEHRIRRADGIYRWHLSRAEPLRDRDGQIVQWFGVDIDIDDQKLAEEKLRELRTNLSQTSKSSMVAELSASIVHEINQPLTSLLSNAQACFRWLNAAQPNIQEAVASVGRVIRNVRTADATMRNIRSLFERQPFLKAPFNMVALIREAMGLIK